MTRRCCARRSTRRSASPRPVSPGDRGRELSELEHAIPSVQAPVLLLADPRDTLVPVGTARRLARALPDARLQLVQDTGPHLPRRGPDTVAAAIAAFLAATEEPAPRSETRSRSDMNIP